MKTAETVGLLDPSLGTQNQGDLIIYKSVMREITKVADQVVRLPTRRPWTEEERLTAKRCELFFVGGTNLLVSNPRRYRQWIVTRAETKILRTRVVLMGVGWWQYQDLPTSAQRRWLTQILHAKALHSVRDSYTQHQLHEVPRKIVNTQCMTMWEITTPPRMATENCRIITSVTDYLPDPVRDAKMLQTLVEMSDNNLSVWLQGARDRTYLHEIGYGWLRTIESLSDFEAALEEDVFYCGTRLHAGIAALQKNRPALIVAIDNRALEIASDCGLSVIYRDDIDLLAEELKQYEPVNLRLPWAEIQRWRESINCLI